ncbi:hypothetical protein VTK73DRAFT_4407 [Phialemonium thermophilum]|uniref:Uncharacterized protein n=1 Tax=Phialemonium thermophilum TaxID=223376 RepID=A0ABR3V8W7_9PEZI
MILRLSQVTPIPRQASTYPGRANPYPACSEYSVTFASCWLRQLTPRSFFPVTPVAALPNEELSSVPTLGVLDSETRRSRQEKRDSARPAQMW